MTSAVVGLVPGTYVEVVHWTSPHGDGECTVTWLPTDRLDLQVLCTEVSAVERQRAAGYTRANDRLLSLGSAWLMRQLVGNCLDLPPRDVPVVRRCARCAKPHGRPMVGAVARDGAAVHVSATHSGGLVGVALSTSGAVGLDLEDVQGRGPDAWPAVWRVLGRPIPPVSQAGGPEAAGRAATAWVRTEALLKATGHGLAVDPGSVHISPGENPAVIGWPWGDPTGRVSLFNLQPGRRYVAALAALHDGSSDFEPATAKGRFARRAT